MADNETGKFSLSSSAFEDGGNIPARFTCDGENINPPLTLANIPHGTQTLALVVEDPDAPNGTFDHWVIWDIETTSLIGENTNPGISGVNGAGKTGYHGPCPPSGSHRYLFHVYALDIVAGLEPGSNKQLLHDSMQGHILDEAALMGRYERSGAGK